MMCAQMYDKNLAYVTTIATNNFRLMHTTVCMNSTDTIVYVFIFILILLHQRCIQLACL